MSDLISRQAAIEAICGECQGSCIPCDSYPCGEIDAIKAVPSAEPERKKGRWILRNEYSMFPFVCDQCETWSNHEHKFCPNCGADMRGEQE